MLFRDANRQRKDWRSREDKDRTFGKGGRHVRAVGSVAGSARPEIGCRCWDFGAGGERGTENVEACRNKDVKDAPIVQD